jgi:hypothetical protein
MKLSNIAILAVRGHRDIKRMLSEALDVSEPTVYRWIQENSDNLTKAAALQIIEKETGLTRDQILKSEPVGQG